jgi:hypothetical protein
VGCFFTVGSSRVNRKLLLILTKSQKKLLARIDYLGNKACEKGFHGSKAGFNSKKNICVGMRSGCAPVRSGALNTYNRN